MEPAAQEARGDLKEMIEYIEQGKYCLHEYYIATPTSAGHCQKCGKHTEQSEDPDLAEVVRLYVKNGYRFPAVATREKKS